MVLLRSERNTPVNGRLEELYPPTYTSESHGTVGFTRLENVASVRASWMLLAAPTTNG